MSTQMKTSVVLLTIAFILLGVAGIFTLQSADALAEGERISKQMNVPHNDSIPVLCILGSIFFGVGLYLAIHATIKPLPRSVFGKT